MPFSRISITYWIIKYCGIVKKFLLYHKKSVLLHHETSSHILYLYYIYTLFIPYLYYSRIV